MKSFFKWQKFIHKNISYLIFFFIFNPNKWVHEVIWFDPESQHCYLCPWAIHLSILTTTLSSKCCFLFILQLEKQRYESQMTCTKLLSQQMAETSLKLRSLWLYIHSSACYGIPSWAWACWAQLLQDLVPKVCTNGLINQNIEPN